MSRAEYDEHAHRMVSWARLYARAQWPVFPLARGTKVPALKKELGGRGCLDATVDLELVERMWRKFPGANIGVATGGTTGLAILDADVATGGKESLKALVAAHGPLPSGPMAKTRTGGRHYVYLSPPGGVSNSASRLAPGLDLRGTGGYFVVAPSVTPAGSYEWITDWRTPLEVMPRWLIPAPIPPTPIRSREAVGTADADRVLAGLARKVSEATEGNRNAALFWAACRLGEHAQTGRIPLDSGAAELLSAALAVGLTETEADRTLRSALRRVGPVAA